MEERCTAGWQSWATDRALATNQGECQSIVIVRHDLEYGEIQL